MKDVIASYEVLVSPFRTHTFFLQRLNHYTAVPLTPEMTSLLGKMMAQVPSVLALSTKAMKERRISESFRLVFSLITDYGVEEYLKRLVGKKHVEDALERLDMLAKEENLITAARNLEVSHHLDANVKVIHEVTHRVDDKVTRIEHVVHDVDGNVKATKEFTHQFHENVISIKEDTRIRKNNSI